MKIAINEVVVKKRLRKENGDLAELAASLTKYGQLQPILINNRNELIAGFRRLQAAKMAGWVMIEARIVDKNKKLDKLEMEIEENWQRLPFTDDELYDALQKIEKLKRPNIFQKIKRIWNKLFSGKRD